MKKWLLIIILVVASVLAPVLAPPAAQARGGVPCILGAFFGLLAGLFVAKHLEVVPANPPPPMIVPQCYRQVPEQMIPHWQPDSPYPVYERIPAHLEIIPCPGYR